MGEGARARPENVLHPLYSQTDLWQLPTVCLSRSIRIRQGSDGINSELLTKEGDRRKSLTSCD